MDRGHLEQLREQGHEIAAHGRYHRNTKGDILHSVADLKKWDLVDTKVGFASPGSGLSPSECVEWSGWFTKNDILYVRTGVAEQLHQRQKGIKRKIMWLVGLDGNVLINDLNNNPMPMKSTYGLTSQVVVRNTTATHVENVVLRAANTDAVVLMFHHILDGDGLKSVTGRKGLYTWSDKRFEQVCRWLASRQEKGLCKVLTTNKVVMLQKDLVVVN